MSIIMRIIQQFDAAKEKEFMELEKKFAELEMNREDYPKGKRLQPISATEPCNSLIWEHEFSDIQTAYKTLDFFSGDASHEELLAQQLPFFKQAKVEFYKKLTF